MESHYGKGMTFDHDVMRAYTQSGKYVDYVVWPTLYLHRDGALLAKAVVQSTSDPHRLPNTPHRLQAWTNTADRTIDSSYTSNVEQKNQNLSQNFNRPVYDTSVKSAADVLQYRSPPHNRKYGMDKYGNTDQRMVQPRTDDRHNRTHMNTQTNEHMQDKALTRTYYEREPQRYQRANQYDGSKTVRHMYGQRGNIPAESNSVISYGTGGYSSGRHHGVSGGAPAAFQQRGDTPDVWLRHNQPEYDKRPYNPHRQSDQKSTTWAGGRRQNNPGLSELDDGQYQRGRHGNRGHHGNSYYNYGNVQSNIETNI